MDTKQRISYACGRLEQLLHYKNAKYGDSALKPKRILAKASAVDGILQRIDDKLSRIANGYPTRNDAQDLAGYFILLDLALEDDGCGLVPSHDDPRIPEPVVAAAIAAENLEVGSAVVEAPPAGGMSAPLVAPKRRGRPRKVATADIPTPAFDDPKQMRVPGAVPVEATADVSDAAEPEGEVDISFGPAPDASDVPAVAPPAQDGGIRFDATWSEPAASEPTVTINSPAPEAKSPEDTQRAWLIRKGLTDGVITLDDAFAADAHVILTKKAPAGWFRESLQAYQAIPKAS
jgi:hypothetical protein